MLDNKTKQKIDTLRNILVGKITDPKSQIDQITIALIYKFMQDMDNEAIELGGKPSFFVETFAKYSWDSLFSSQLSGIERVDLYSEAMVRMNQNPHLPRLFREIFKDANLPFRDPSTLFSFLKRIDDFHYSDDSESLGDAFEYLLSCLSTQGDAGQFRTPRHIIDYIVEIIEPQKDESILDPACGTAGFLISAFQYLIEKNKNLSAEELKKIYENIVGLDIDPNMVRFSLANLYLHRFSNPKIFEYDSLTQDDRWNEYYDIILANPPFFSPKGGIKPHNNFSLKSKRAELLFLDYITSHLTPNGRAAVIIPDGVIANAGPVYKNIRKHALDQNGLFAITSLPAGVFLPYSDVKTSILFFDKKLRNINHIFFSEIKNDGYQLSSNRKKINKNDISQSIKDVKNFRTSILRNNYSSNVIAKNFISDVKEKGIIVQKDEVLRAPKYSLSGKRYKKRDININSDFEIISLTDEFIEKKSILFKNMDNSKIENSWSVSNKFGFVESDQYFGHRIASDDMSKYKVIDKGYYAYNPARINVGSIAYNNEEKVGIVSPMYVVFKLKNNDRIHPLFLLEMLKSEIGIKQIIKFSDGSVRQTLSLENFKYIKIPLPSLKVQKELLKTRFEVIDLHNEISHLENKLSLSINNVWNK
jgi:type I restriction enzyme M protein